MQKNSKIVELKHLDNVKGNFAVTESHYGGSANTNEGKEGLCSTGFLYPIALYMDKGKAIFQRLLEYNHRINHIYFLFCGVTTADIEQL